MKVKIAIISIWFVVFLICWLSKSQPTNRQIMCTMILGIASIISQTNAE